jgi:nitrite reductase/ring-hydroxylating ferredoxin subunit
MATKANETTPGLRPTGPYLDAAWGLKNHWYPGVFSEELAEGGVQGIQICGLPILLRRAKGKVYGLSDQCIHRGVRMSKRPTCLTDSTVTCWYHGFTYDLNDGKLVSIVAAPDDKLIGKARVRTFPIQEYKGIVFVFVGDEDYAPLPALTDDLPMAVPDDYEFRAPHILDDDVVLKGIHRTGNANWRLACENGFDVGHVLIHQDNALVLARNAALPLGYKPLSNEAYRVMDGDGPKGLINDFGSEHFELVLENKELGISSGSSRYFGVRTSVFLPGVLMVENFPELGATQFEWYVPIDDHTHTYWQVVAMNCPDEKARQKFDFRYENLHEPLALRDFNDHDLFAREQMEPFYADQNGWENEVLCSLDTPVVTWRRIVSKHNRGIQSPPG